MTTRTDEAGAGSRRLVAPGRVMKVLKHVKPALVTVACLLVTAIGAQTASAAGAPRIAAHQYLALLLSTHDVHDRPNGAKVGFVPPNRPLTGERTVLPILG